MAKIEMADGSIHEEVRQNGKLLGAFVTTPSGGRYYQAYRRHNEIFRSGRGTLSAAVEDGTACWALDVVTLGRVKSQGVRLISVLVRETQDQYFTVIDAFYDPKKATVRNYEKRGGALQRYLPLTHWKKVAGNVSL